MLGFRCQVSALPLAVKATSLIEKETFVLHYKSAQFIKQLLDRSGSS
jgi:hypothetical protein